MDLDSKRKTITVLSVILGLASLACMISAFVASANAEYDGYAEGFYYDESDEIVRLRRCTRTGDVEIPSMLNGKEVTEIGNYNYAPESFFTDPASVTSVTLPNTITEIHDNTFSGCSSLDEVYIPSSVVEIGDYVFEYCSSLREVFISNSVTNVGYNIFSGCTALEEITMPFFTIVEYRYNSEVYMPFSAFFADSIYRYRQITNGMTINMSCSEDDLDRYFFDDYGYFEDCMATEINLTGDLRVIGNSTFADCTNLARVTLPSTVTEISSNAFSDCTALENITLPDGLQAIGDAAFSGCAALEEIILPDGVQTIEMYAFIGCTALKSITLPSKLSSIDSSAFSGCTALEEIALPDGVQTIGNYAFRGCTALESITLPDGLQSIGDDAFSGCANLRSIIIPLSVTQISDDAFENCPQLTIYAEAASKPVGWIERKYQNWNPDDRPVVWGYRE